MSNTYILGKIGLNTRGAYSAEENYDVLDVVSYAGSSYICKAACANQPPENAEYWNLLAEGKSERSEWTNIKVGNEDVRYRKEGSRVCIEGIVRTAYNGSGNTYLFTLPEGYRPKFCYHYSLRPCAGKRVARICITLVGDVWLEWVVAISNGGSYTGTNWVDISTEFETDDIPEAETE